MSTLTPEELLHAKMLSLYSVVTYSLAMQFRHMKGDHHVAARELAQTVGDFIDMMDLSGMPSDRLSLIKEFMRFHSTEIISTAANSVSNLPRQGRS